MAAEPPMGQLDPEDQDSDDDDLEIGLMGETPKHFAVQVISSLRPDTSEKHLEVESHASSLRHRLVEELSSCLLLHTGHTLRRGKMQLLKALPRQPKDWRNEGDPGGTGKA